MSVFDDEWEADTLCLELEEIWGFPVRVVKINAQHPAIRATKAFKVEHIAVKSGHAEDGLFKNAAISE